VTPATEPCINRLGPSVSSSVVAHYLKETAKNSLFSRFPYQPSQGFEVFFDRPWTMSCSFTATHMED